ncbi:hypothetical protein [Desulfuromonas acetoxidans]|uniref:hypothetical protein n=1 Tax=Desulfuromonas acetoxidans TaxID=891 RepID=UPI00292EE67D|nr:hypothetical protein [Desulfuromonas acetoxidans]
MTIELHRMISEDISSSIQFEKNVLSEKLDVSLDIDGKKITLLIALNKFTDSLYVEDLQGNGYYSNFQGKGTGTFLFNTALQFLKNHYPDSILVSGQMSTVGDPDEPDQAEACRNFRSNFWQSFGFTVVPGDIGYEKVEAKLGELKIKPGRLLLGKFPCLVDISEFEEK